MLAAWRAGLPWGVLAVVLASCNGLTGIDSLTFNGTDASSGSSSGGSSGGSGSGGSSGGGDSGNDGAPPCRPEAGNQCTSEGRSCGADSCGNPCGGCDGGAVCAGGDSGAVSPTYQCIDQSVGCADGSREGFKNVAAYPGIAACAAGWPLESMQASRTGAWCGNDLGPCTVPEDACSPGWHLCMRNGWPGDLNERVNAADCKSAVAGAGLFMAGSSDRDTNGVCTYPIGCTSQNGLCCGSQGVGVSPQQCVWPGTQSGSAHSVCNAVTGGADGVTGVLCCKDPPLTGTGPADAGGD